MEKKNKKQNCELGTHHKERVAGIISQAKEVLHDAQLINCGVYVHDIRSNTYLLSNLVSRLKRKKTQNVTQKELSDILSYVTRTGYLLYQTKMGR